MAFFLNGKKLYSRYLVLSRVTWSVNLIKTKSEIIQFVRWNVAFID